MIETPLGKVGLLACWDLIFPEAFREMIARGAKLIILPSYWTMAEASAPGLKYNPKCEQLVLNSMVTARCFENTCAVIFVNSGNASPRCEDIENISIGESQVTVPFIGPLGKLEDEEGMIVTDLDMQIMDDAEENYKVRGDLARSNWHYIYRHSHGINDQSVRA